MLDIDIFSCYNKQKNTKGGLLMKNTKKLINIRYALGVNELIVKCYEAVENNKFKQSRWMSEASKEEGQDFLCLDSWVNKIRNYRNIEYSVWTDFPLEKALKIFKRRVSILIKSTVAMMETQVDNFLQNLNQGD